MLIVIAVLPFLFWPKPAGAFLGAGGRILFVVPCVNGLLLTIGPPRPGLYMWMWGTPIYAWYELVPGPNVLINYVLGGICIMPGLIPVIIPALGTIVQIGTSAF